jgi:hypothetical protein
MSFFMANLHTGYVGDSVQRTGFKNPDNQPGFAGSGTRFSVLRQGHACGQRQAQRQRYTQSDGKEGCCWHAVSSEQ